jgi:hypothetical protein
LRANALVEKVCNARFTNDCACDFEPPVAHQRVLTISDIGLGEGVNPQSLQGFLPLWAANPFVLSQANRIDKNT